MEAMLTVDTNVVVRLLVEDDPRESAQAKRLFEDAIVFIPATVFMETEWVLRAVYDFSRDEIAGAFARLLRVKSVRVADRPLLETVNAQFAQGLDFADALHYAFGADQPMKTFDKAFIKRGQALGLDVECLL
jgi:predicted nucleic-acid-binding protein